MKRAATAILVMSATAMSATLVSLSFAHGAPGDAQQHAREATQRRVRGIITAVDPATVTISPTHHPCITGRIDPTRTRILVDGHPGRISDLHITYTVRAELSLDDVWMTIRVDSH
jgi:hypothetical protein